MVPRWKISNWQINQILPCKRHFEILLWHALVLTISVRYTQADEFETALSDMKTGAAIKPVLVW
jgi:hypothetical protein